MTQWWLVLKQKCKLRLKLNVLGTPLYQTFCPSTNCCSQLKLEEGSEVGCVIVAKMASHAIFQYNVLAIDDTHNTWTNMIVKINIPRLLGSSDDKEKRGVARPEGPPLRGFR